jgi:ribose 1,5-bisphosphate isomerase
MKMGFDRTVKDIKSLKIQGAENVAKEAVKSLRFVISKKRATHKQLLTALSRARNELFKTRPTEPCMRNALNFVLSDLSHHPTETGALTGLVSERIDYVLDFFKRAEEKIIEYGAQKIKDGMVVYTHCHSSTVVKILLSAWKQGKHFEVHNTETRPRYQGRMTSSELAKKGIPVVHYVDSAARFALKKSDVMLIGADAITVEGKVVNKVGSELFAEVANRYDVPVYVCTNSWKFDPETVHGFEEPIEKRDGKEVWEKPPRGVRVENPAFEKIGPGLVTGAITELGVFKPQTLVQQVQKHYPWMFNSNI